MNKAIGYVADLWHREPPADERAIARVESELDVVFPVDYREFLLWSNGGQAQVGSAYFSFWRVWDIVDRNISASIKKYMSPLFVGIGTNGGGECYALDYSDDISSPNFVIVPLGDLDHASKFVIASSLAGVFEKSLNGDFSDADYNDNEIGPLTEEMLNIRRKNIMYEAENYWQKKEYSKFIALLSKSELDLTDLMRKK
ncbi:hypothetical protein GO496_00825 [Acidovorax citrulli]|nr:hypothetical protein [Paracidovorax citrulli]